MMALLHACTLALLFQDGAAAGAEPASGAATPPPAAAGAPNSAQPQASAAADPADRERVERELMLRRLLLEVAKDGGAPALDVAAIQVMEQEVAALRAAADAMAGQGANTAIALREAPLPAEELERLGISAERAKGIRDLSEEVQDLRARLLVQDLRTGKDPAPADPAASQAGAEAADGAEPAPQGAAAGSEPAAEAVPAAGSDAVAPAPALTHALRYPARAIELLFRAGDLERLIGVAEQTGTDRLGPDSRYAYACALAAVGRADQARAVFEQLAAATDRTALAQASARQVDRLDQLKLGVVGADPLARERSKP